MVLQLIRHVSQNGFKLTWAHRKSAIAALPEKSAIASVECFDPLRRELLDLLDQLGLRQRSWERCDNVNVIGNTADVHEFDSKIAAHRCEIGVHARSNVRIEPGFTIFRAEDDVNDDFTQGLRHAGDDVLNVRQSESHFQRLCSFLISQPWGVAPGL